MAPSRGVTAGGLWASARRFRWARTTGLTMAASSSFVLGRWASSAAPIVDGVLGFCAAQQSQ
jgi:hypothetical protein